jgi:fatty-acyl-CoA synthase
VGPESRTFGGLLHEIALRTPNAPALFDHTDQITYAELWASSRAIAKSLHALGVRRGDRVAGLISNRREWILLAFASGLLGAIYAPLNTWSKLTELEFALGHLEARVLVAMDAFLSNEYTRYIDQLLPGLRHASPGELESPRFPRLQAVVLLGRPHPGAFTWNEFADLGRAVPDSAIADAMSAVTGADPLYILYTSGSTAEPKGVVLSHGPMIENAFAIGVRRAMNPADRLWLGTPLFYSFGAVNALPAAMSHGAAIVIQGHFEAGSALDVIEATRATVFYGIGTIPQALMEHPAYSRRRIASLTKGHPGLSPADRERVIVQMGIRQATQSYGMTEAYGHSTVGEPDDALETKLYTAGRPLPGFEFKIVDPATRRPVRPGESGLVLLRGHLLKDYFRNPAETAKAMDGGYFNTGDLGAFDEEGRFRFQGRAKEVIKSSGNNVSALEVEALLLRHPKVADASVVGIPASAGSGVGELIVAYVDAEEGTSENELKSHVKAIAASFKVPYRVFFRASADLPRLATGKVAKLQLQADATQAISSS